MQTRNIKKIRHKKPYKKADKTRKEREIIRKLKGDTDYGTDTEQA